MTPQEITEAYNVISEEVADTVASDAAAIGNAQRSLGTLASEVASPSGQTSGLANYTYNRVMRPTVDTLTTSLVTSGRAQALNQYLTNSLREAQRNYDRAKNAYQRSLSSAASGSGSGRSNQQEVTDNTFNVVGQMGGITRVDSPADMDMAEVIGTTHIGGNRWQVIYSNAGSGGSQYTTVEVTANSKEEAIQVANSQYGFRGSGGGGGGAGGSGL